MVTKDIAEKTKKGILIPIASLLDNKIIQDRC